jgi:hypothetical protein
MAPSRTRMSAWIWLFPGPAIVVAQVALKAYDQALYRRWMRSEKGLVENLTVAFLLCAIACCFLCFRYRARVRWRFFGPLMLVMAAGLVFFAGEEMSWGQHLFGFAPPESIAARNEQQEFNLHNDPLLETVLDSLPRTVLTLVALVGGIIAPLARRKRGLHDRDFQDPRPWGWIWPTFECMPAAILAVGLSLPEKIIEAFGRSVPSAFDISPGETKEYCIGLFFLVYMLSLLLALRRAPTLAPSA